MPLEATRQMLAPLVPAAAAGDTAAEASRWADVAARLQSMWLAFQAEQGAKAVATPTPLGDIGWWLDAAQAWYKQMPLTEPERQKQLWSEGIQLWESVLGQYGIGPKAKNAENGEPDLPRHDPRFADPKWREQPVFALIHQTYLMLAEQLTAMADGIEGLDPERKEQLRFATRALVDAVSPSHFPLTNPLVIDRAIETKGESLVKGMEHLIADLRKGQLTHTDPTAFKLGENIAVTPGKVVHETPLFQLIQYAPTTDNVLEVPLVIFPPWINRYYILDLNPKKSFVAWAVAQGVSVFIVSWKSADASMADVVWDDYVRAQIEAIDHVCQRLKVPATHVIGYCVAGTTLAATLSILARRGEAAKVKSATFFTAQVDFEKAGDLKLFIDGQQLAAMAALSAEGYIDGRYLAATFNLLRGNDLIWNYVVDNYMLGKDYPAFDLLHWNGDATNLPAKWHQSYLKDLYRDNRLVVPDAMSVDGTPVDLRRIATPAYIQAGREDHIAPPESVWRLTRHLAGPWTFVLAGSGHIAGVVNPPAAKKYQYWTNDAPVDTLEEFVAGATEHPGSWWPHWLQWLRTQDAGEVPAKGKRVPGSRGDKVIEDAPGRYVRMR
ncbi:MAG: class I poly(R)-hydroxyalkanoic acid synthase [Novosphingobium sp.]|nr:class I poly(R)-hydroxyalkanoic acid synthase [Novosphingobium sp.]